eukprot:8980428-Alexandrium_andersonii.AAC.1
MSASLVGSEMCIRDRALPDFGARILGKRLPHRSPGPGRGNFALSQGAVSYTHLTLPTICSV